MLAELVWKTRANQLIDAAPRPMVAAALRVGQLPGSGSWLLSPPAFGSRFSNAAWRCAARLRLALPVYSRPAPCPLCTHGQLDIYGIHAISCAGDYGAIHRHNAVRDMLFSLARQAHLPVKKEQGFLLTDDRSGPKPADLYFLNWEGGASLCLDVSVANSFEFLHEYNRPFAPLEPLIHRHNDKIKKYRNLCTARGVRYQPFVCGSLAGFTDEAASFIKQLGTALSCTMPFTREQGIAHVYRRVSFVLQLMQAEAILTRGEEAGVLL